MTEWLVLATVTAAACAVVLVVTLLGQRGTRGFADGMEAAGTPQTPDVLEYMVMMVGVVYAIVLGLAIAGVWEARGAAQDAVRAEAQALHEVTQRAQVYPADFREQLRTNVDAYVSEVVQEEWPRMIDQEELSPRGTELLATVRTGVAEREPANELEAQAYQPMLDQVAAAEDARGARASGAEETLPGIVWFGLISGAVVTIGLIFTMQIGRSFRELLLAGVFSALIAFLLFLVWDFDAPFGRSGTESADAFRQLFPGAGGTG
ncbi:DUF4239 domain-containing protein [Streptomyces sp. PKU-EA00015]|uniref:bestrophin-like domain n=1 Tax=Streptomyces sp. PKU-EA00015 TaxID=2748326 RepID=UPI0015A3B74B|nr:DUF4239 domain-containing protein [Streptomyces sp. PKU-EA00015]NWF26915.1 DUF4239 domain-containing protein [Streptomyces sp. PKU-EA00015]